MPSKNPEEGKTLSKNCGELYGVKKWTQRNGRRLYEPVPQEEKHRAAKKPKKSIYYIKPVDIPITLLFD